ncbi:MAG TPA: hypothetical protein VHG10_15380 [Glycomyces sp.]|nr:hypothetical protein [Glycomyces sp.]
MAGLTDDERRHLQETIARRLGARSDAVLLTVAYLDAMAHNAYARTVGPGPVPTSLTSERSEILVEICRQLERMIEDFEIQALFRVTATQARSMRTALQAAHSDIADELDLHWSLRGAKNPKRRKGDSFTGEVIVFATEDRRDAFIRYAERSGIAVEPIRGEADKPWQVIVSDDLPRDRLPQ